MMVVIISCYNLILYIGLETFSQLVFRSEDGKVWAALTSTLVNHVITRFVNYMFDLSFFDSLRSLI